ncbi:RNA polymerase sigma factor [Anaerostipes hominis (ex Lee et al. 2021)]
MELTLIIMLSKTKKVFTTYLTVLCSIASLKTILSAMWKSERLSLLFVPPTWRRNGDYYERTKERQKRYINLIEKICFVVCGIEVLVQKSELSIALEKLPEIKRNVLLLSCFEELSDTDIAELMNVTRNGIYKRRQSALQLMKELLQEE